MKLKPFVFFVFFAVILGAIIIVGIQFSKASPNCVESNSRMAKMHIENIQLLNGHGKILQLRSHIANNNQKRADGYQNICAAVIDQTSILFVYPSEISARFHMRNVKAPLDIGFFDNTGRLIKSLLMQTYEDGNNRLYSPGQPFQFALEARAGFFKEHYLTNGKARLILNSVK